ncbi:MAG: hypothetical protein HY520_02490 [Candidatus Aenigmarchaeota archaeon]|nr:hypothetical protein [Candidatus Aenigmarchaeota archaeon]
MKIFVDSQGFVDLEAPVHVTEAQKDAIIQFFKQNFNDFETEEVQEKERYVGDKVVTNKRWTVKDYCLILSPESKNVYALSKKMDRSTMSIRMQMGDFVPSFMIWLKEKGYAFSNDERLVEKFMKEGKKT